jgi:hypothetical protein
LCCPRLVERRVRFVGSAFSRNRRELVRETCHALAATRFARVASRNALVDEDVRVRRRLVGRLGQFRHCELVVGVVVVVALHHCADAVIRRTDHGIGLSRIPLATADLWQPH